MFQEKLGEISLYNIFLDAMHKYGDIPIVDDGTDCFTYSDLLSCTDTFVEKFAAMGIGKGTHVGLWSRNSNRWVAAFLACAKLNAVAVLVNHALPAAEAAELMKRMDTEYLVFGENSALDKDPEAIPAVLETLNMPAERSLDLEKIEFVHKTEFARHEFTEAQSREPMYMIFTSGSTGMPKGVLCSQYAMIIGMKAHAIAVPEAEGTPACVASPLFHCFALSRTMAHIAVGAKVYIPRDTSPAHLIHLVHDNGVHTMVAVVTVYLKMMEQPDFEELAAPVIDYCFTGGSYISPTQLLRVETAFQGAKLLNGYGQTEADAICVMRPSDPFEKRSQSVGRPFPDKTVAIWSPEEGFLPTGRIGEVIVKQEGNLMVGYYKLPPEKSPVDAEGWNHTEDLGYLDEEGYLHLCGRIKDIIIKGGENITPSTIENIMIDLDGIRDVRVMGAPHPIYGETVEACVRVDDPDSFDEDACKEQLKSKLAKFKIPDHIFAYAAFPLRSNGKLDQTLLKSDMLQKLQLLQIDEALRGGIKVFDITLKNTAYAIVPTCELVSSMALSFGFSEQRAAKIRLCTEELLTERVINAYADVGDITLELRLFSDLLRVSLRDAGVPLDIVPSPDSSDSMKILLKLVDDFGTARDAEDRAVCNLDFLYDTEFDIRQYLLAHERNK